VGITRRVHVFNSRDDAATEVEALIDQLDDRPGALFSSSYEVPRRYARWTMGFVDPPVVFSGRDRDFELKALNARGDALLKMFRDRLDHEDAVASLEWVLDDDASFGSSLKGTVKEPPVEVSFAEEERSKQPSLLSVVRAIRDFLYHPAEPQLGLYGGFGYDLMFQFEPLGPEHTNLERDALQRDLVLFLPDDILVVDQRENSAWRVTYDFSWCSPSDFDVLDTATIERDEAVVVPPSATAAAAKHPPEARDMAPGEFAEMVALAKKEFKAGNLFEVVLSQQWRVDASSTSPSAVFRELRQRNPAPYGFVMNLGDREFLVGASPEMFVRVERVAERGLLRVETCPISGTIERGEDAIEDASQVRLLLSSAKDESELTMCTDVDRNDKSRVCVPGTVSVLGRRQIEMYSKLIHTVDHVEGYLREGFDALDAFLCHTWAVTVTGAPKAWASRFIEKHEKSPRAWYGGAVGHVAFDGSMNTGLTLRTVHFLDGVAAVRAGATLLYDSDPAAEEAETELKASAMRDAIQTCIDRTKKQQLTSAGSSPTDEATAATDDKASSSSRSATSSSSGGSKKPPPTSAGEGKRVLLVDHEDSFVHTLANYLRQTGADVKVCRFGAAASLALRTEPWDLVVLSPGPGRPEDFDVSGTISLALERRVPLFGVCLGLQGMVEHFGGSLGVLDEPVHGKPATVDAAESLLFDGLPASFDVARYHSLFGKDLPADLRPTALSRHDGVVMAIEHSSLPMAAVQFHPESILTNPRHGLQILANALTSLSFGDSSSSTEAVPVAASNGVAAPPQTVPLKSSVVAAQQQQPEGVAL